MNELAVILHTQGQYKKAELLQVQVLEFWKQTLGENHPDTIVAKNNLASTWQAQGRYKEAELLRVQVLELRKQALGENQI